MNRFQMTNRVSNKMAKQRLLRALIMGSPGSGKGTQTKRILENHPTILPFTSGDILRSHIQQKTPLGLRIESTLAKGELVQDHLMSPLILSQLDSCQANCFLLDGYPRTIDQAKELDYHLQKEHSPINFVINLQVDWSTVFNRCDFG